MEELNLAIKQKLNITGDFSLQYLDADFDDFFTLNFTAQIKHKATIKVVIIEPVILNLYPAPCNESYSESVTPEQSLDAASTSGTAQDSLGLCGASPASSVSMPSSSSNPEKEQWQTEFLIPRFSVETKMIERANKVYIQNGTLLTTPKISNQIYLKS